MHRHLLGESGHGALAVAALCLGVTLSVAPSAAQGQQSESASDALRVFFDCSGRDCNSRYYRTEIPWVNWVRDRTLAQVHLIMTSEQNASGGREYSFDFLGQEALEGQDDLLNYMSLGTDTREESLRGISQVLAIGLARYSVLAGAGEGLEVRRSGEARGLTDRLVTILSPNATISGASASAASVMKMYFCTGVQPVPPYSDGQLIPDQPCACRSFWY